MYIRLVLLFVFAVVMGGAIFSSEGKSDTLFRFVHLSDIHIGSGGSEEDLVTTISDINAQDAVAFVIITGDITEFGSDVELMLAKKLLDKIQKPWYIVPGNHDTKWSESGGSSFRKIFGSETSSFEYKGYWFVGTNCGPNMRMGPGQIPRENLEWLDSMLLVNADKKQPMFFFNHYPLDQELNNWYEVLDRLHDRNLKAVFCGHGHLNKQLNFEGVPGIMGRSNLRAKQGSAGYNIVTVSSDSLIYNERRSGIETLHAWARIGLNKVESPVWTKNPARPDYSVNTRSSKVKATWTINEKTDIGSSVGRYRDNIIYTSTGGLIRMVRAKDGSELWKFNCESKIYSTPLVLGNRVIVPSTNGNIYCLEANNGRLAWTYQTNKSIVSSAAGEGQLVVVAGSDGHCRALDLVTGKLRWDYNEINNFVETKPLIQNGTVYFGSWGNEFYALDLKTGEPTWTWRSGQTNRMFSPAACLPVISGNRLFMVSPDRFMTVLDKRNGQVIWRNYDTLTYNRESMGISPDQDQVYVKTLQGKVQAIDALHDTRKVLWTSPLDLKFDVCPSPLTVSGNLLFIPTQSGDIYALNRQSGAVQWRYKISNCIVNTVYPIDGDRLIASSMDGKIVCLQY